MNFTGGEECPKRVNVTLKGSTDVHEKQGSRSGVYTKVPEKLSGGMPYWRLNNHAIWFSQGSWRIGHPHFIGNTTAHLVSKDAVPCPNSDILGWKYHAGPSFEDASKGDVTITTA